MPSRLIFVTLFLPLIACNQSTDGGANNPGSPVFGPDDFAYSNPAWPHGSDDSDLATRNTECSATGATLPEAASRYEAQCDLPRSDCDPVGSQWVCSSAQITNGTVANVTPVNLLPYQSPSNSSQAIDPSTYGQGSFSDRSGYDLVFSDEFNAGEINADRWNTQLRWDGEFNGERFEYRVVNGESQFYVNTLSDDREHREEVVPLHNPFELDGNRLAIRAKVNPAYSSRETVPFGALNDMLPRQPFLSGVLSSHNKFSQKYGYFEARIKIPNTTGTFPAFWLFHQRTVADGTYRSEIDVMENLGHAPWYVYNSYHYHNNVSNNYSGDANFLVPDPSGQVYTGTDYSENFHVYAVDWEPGRISWFIDGEKVSELVSDKVDFEEMYIILNLAIGGNWVNYPENAGGLGREESEHFPTNDEKRAGNFSNPALEIDYVRAYRRR